LKLELKPKTKCAAEWFYKIKIPNKILLFLLFNGMSRAGDVPEKEIIKKKNQTLITPH
jgi:hypothetical protein